MNTTTRHQPTARPLTTRTRVRKLQEGDVICHDDPTLEATVTGTARRLGGTGLWAIPLTRGATAWNGRLTGDHYLTVRRIVTI